ncbi:MAG TPA: hypothetical protein VMA37_01750 [Acetobacteraceae bacterium]|nr:hypothetical protein [Acetobacteraceae bacterium]
MKRYCLVLACAMLLLVPALAGAATANQQQSTMVVASSAQPSPASNGSVSQSVPAFAPQPNVSVSATIPNGQASNSLPGDSTLRLVNGTGGGG